MFSRRGPTSCLILFGNFIKVSLENGIVVNFDARTLSSDVYSPSNPLFTLSAHEDAVCGLAVNPHVRGCIATGGEDKMVKVWNVNEAGGGNKLNVSLVTSRDLEIVSHSFSRFSFFSSLVIWLSDGDVLCALGEGIFSDMVS